MRIINQFGLQRSGTNALKAIIEVNTDCLVLPTTFGHKHKASSWEDMDEWIANHPRPDDLEPDVYAAGVEDLRKRRLFSVLSVKDFVSWVDSYHRYRAMKFAYGNPEGHYPFSTKFVDLAFAQWSSNIRGYAAFALENPELCLVVQHERLLAAPGEVLDEFAQRARVFCASPPELFLEGYALRGLQGHRGADLINQGRSFDRSYHLKGEWRSVMTRDVLELATGLQREFFLDNPDARTIFDFDAPGLEI